jgi:flagellar biosynthesis/type III secretory pathway protein FliH
MSIYDELIQEGIKRGRAEVIGKGCAEGIEKGYAESLEKIILNAFDNGIALDLIGAITGENLEKIEAVLKKNGRK